MAKYHIKMDGSAPIMDEVSAKNEEALKKKSKPISVKLSKDLIDKMKKEAGLRGQVTDEKILHAFIVTKLSGI